MALQSSASRLLVRVLRRALPGAIALLAVACADPRGEPADGGGVDGGVTLPPTGPCRPFDIRQCYTGPEGTLGVGQCRQGHQECLPMGLAYGPCEDDVLPREEDCDGTLADEDCDGEINEAGPSCVCPGGRWEPCYEGALETRGVGACRDGQRICDDLGLAWSACTAATTPGPEDCLRPFDEDCDGVADTCPVDFALVFGDASTGTDQDGEWVEAVAASATGDLVIGGTAGAAFELGGERYEDLDGEELYDGFVARLTSSGDVVWAKRFGGEGRSQVTAVAIGASGAVAVGGRTAGTVDYGGGPRTGSGIFVAVFEPGGAHRYSVAYAGDRDDYVRDIALDSADNVYFTGRTEGVDLGGGATTSNAALASLDAAGVYRFDTGFNAQTTRMALHASGVAVSGDQGSAYANDFGEGEVYGDFVVHYALDGTIEWAHVLDGYLDTMDVTVGPDGTVYAIGTTSQFADFGTLPVMGEAGDLFLFEVAPGGAPRAVRLFGEGVQGPANYGSPHDVEHTSDGRLLVVGSFAAAIDLGSGAMPNVAQEDHFVALIATDASAVHWLQRFGTPAREYHGILHGAADGTGGIVLGGRVSEPIDFGTGLLTSRGSLDAFVARLSP